MPAHERATLLPTSADDECEAAAVKVPGASLHAKLMLPVRVAVAVALWSLLYPLLLVSAWLRAIYLRLRVGRPSQILKFGRHGAVHQQGTHYSSMQLYKEPLDKARLRKALIELCSEDGIEEKDVDLQFPDERPNDWPSTGSFEMDHFVESNRRPGVRGRNHHDYMDDWKERGDPPAVIRMHVWNGLPGKPTVAFFFGSGNRWDGSSNFNFVKELMNRYVGNPPNKVFQEPELAPRSAAILDQGSFAAFMLKLPVATAKNLFMFIWGVVRAARWAGGNGIGARIAAMNFTKEDSARLYAGCKRQGVSPFAAFTYAAVKGCSEVLGQRPKSITQQASLQDRHYRLDQQGAHRDLVGDWLVGPVQHVPERYGLQEAMQGYEELKRELDTLGPAVRETFWAKAYGLLNSGAAVFQGPPCYNVWDHCMDRQIFMNNYGVRTMPPRSPFVSWNWNAPLWFGLNTINVDGATTTLMGSGIWGLEVVEAIRDNIESTLREIMTQGDCVSENLAVPTYKESVVPSTRCSEGSSSSSYSSSSTWQS